MNLCTSVSGLLFIWVCAREALSDPGCGGSINNAAGSIRSPGYPGTYPAAARCVWVVNVPVGKTIHVHSGRFSLEESRDCDWDYLEIGDLGIPGDDRRQRFCGSSAVFFTSASNRIVMTFKSDETYQALGFELFYMSDKENASLYSCNKTKTEPGVLFSPGYPNPYGFNIDCYYILRAPPGKTVKLKFSAFDLEEDVYCRFDFLEIFDGPGTDSSLIGRFCGSSTLSFIYSSGISLLLRFVSDGYYQSPLGFKADFEFITSRPLNVTNPTGAKNYVQNTSVCDSVYKKEGSELYSPGFPVIYPPNLNCIMVLLAPESYVVTLTFSAFALEDGDDCEFDRLIIKDGSFPSSKAIDKLCGIMKPGEVKFYKSTENGLRLEFITDATVQYTGFSANYTFSIPGGCAGPCLNGGTCIRGGQCFCINSFTGSNCEIPPRCMSNPCQNGGTCEEDGLVGYKCECLFEFKGKNCEEDSIKLEIKGTSTLKRSESGKLQCNVIGDDTDQVIWLFEDRLLDKQSVFQGLSVVNRKTLIIQNAREEYEGEYTCAIRVGDREYRAKTFLHVLPKCSLDVRQPKNVTANLGDRSVFLICDVSEKGTTVLWLKDHSDITANDKLKIEEGYLEIKNITLFDEGKYTCIHTSPRECSSKISIWLKLNKRNVVHKICGRPKINSPEARGRITSGYKAPVGSAPWFAIFHDSAKKSAFCGGSLISNQWILTAAHCVSEFKHTKRRPFNNNNVRIYLGTQTCSGQNGTAVEFGNVILHPDYRLDNIDYNNDIALIKLKKAVKYSATITPICLESQEFLIKARLLKSGKQGITAGCGWKDSRILAKYLHEVKVPYVRPERCKSSFPESPLTDSMMCAGYATENHGDSCQGDSGGPLIMKYADHWILVGIVSWGQGCDLRNRFGVYTQVGMFKSWIDESID